MSDAAIVTGMRVDALLDLMNESLVHIRLMDQNHVDHIKSIPGFVRGEYLAHETIVADCEKEIEQLGTTTDQRTRLYRIQALGKRPVSGVHESSTSYVADTLLDQMEQSVVAMESIRDNSTFLWDKYLSNAEIVSVCEEKIKTLLATAIDQLKRFDDLKNRAVLD